MKPELGHAVGQCLMIGIGGTTLSAAEADFIRRCGIGGVILFSRNIEGPQQCAALVRQIQSVSDTPLLIGIDQEGGRVARLRAPFTLFPPAGQLGGGPPEQTYRLAVAQATELKSIGINLNFAPVLDVDTHPANPIIGDRSFGQTPGQVIRHASQVISGLQENGIIACGKHFPGHGDTTVDSHLALPAVDHSPDRLDAIELPPFVAAIEAGVACIMTAHILVRQYDAEWPASLSSTIITTLLRERLGFNGVIVSDDLEMKGITQNYTVPFAAVRALQVGSDLLLICQSLDLQQQAWEALVHAVKQGELAEERLAQAYTRIAKLKHRFFISPSTTSADSS
jgi:beta-N-acetylhexosaminidase